MRHIALVVVCVLVASCAAGGSSDPTEKDTGTSSAREVHRLVWDDPRGDVWDVRYAGQSLYLAAEPHPTSAALDITRVAVQHRVRDLVIDVEFAEPWTLGGRDTVAPIDGYIVTDTDTTWAMSISADQWDVYPNVYAATWGDTCRRVDADIRTDRATTRLSIPRSCLGGPRWVRVYFAAVTTRRDTDAYGDSAMDDQFPATRKDVSYSEPVYARGPS